MPDNLARKMKRKRVKLDKDNSDAYVDIPVITEMQILGTNAQLFKYKIVNDSSNITRLVRVQNVKAAKLKNGRLEYDPNISIDVERIKQMDFLGTNAQLFKYKFINKDPAPMTPEGADEPHHWKKQYVRFYKNNDSNSEHWIDIELIDKMQVLGPNAQLFKFKLANPELDTPVNDGEDPYAVNATLMQGFCDPGLELLQGGEGIDPPWRLDPFQNIVNISSKKQKLELHATIDWQVIYDDTFSEPSCECSTACYTDTEGWMPELYPCGKYPTPLNTGSYFTEWHAHVSTVYPVWQVDHFGIGSTSIDIPQDTTQMAFPQYEMTSQTVSLSGGSVSFENFAYGIGGTDCVRTVLIGGCGLWHQLTGIDAYQTGSASVPTSVVANGKEGGKSWTQTWTITAINSDFHTGNTGHAGFTYTPGPKIWS